jgi:methionine-rich copper-binding protein CopC
MRTFIHLSPLFLIGVVLCSPAATAENVGRGNLRRLADDTLAVDLKPLRPGPYTIEWQVLSVDTHITDGLLRFTVSGGK